MLFDKNGVSFLFLLPYQCKAKAENCSETQCPLLPVEDDLVASEFRFKASEKGLRLVYINWSKVVYTNNFSLTRYLCVFITHVDDQQVFPLTIFH